MILASYHTFAVDVAGQTKNEEDLYKHRVKGIRKPNLIRHNRQRQNGPRSAFALRTQVSVKRFLGTVYLYKLKVNFFNGHCMERCFSYFP